jgi:hypothetical protein
VLGRLLVVVWDDDAGAFRHRRSRSALTFEFLRRSALWARATGAENGWPFSDLAGALEPGTRAEAAVERLRAEVGAELWWPPVQQAVEGALHWAALGALPRQLFPELQDPYEPLLVLLERGGGFMTSSGAIELGYGSFPVRSPADRVGLAPRAIDGATLDSLDLGAESAV